MGGESNRTKWHNGIHCNVRHQNVCGYSAVGTIVIWISIKRDARAIFTQSQRHAATEPINMGLFDALLCHHEYFERFGTFQGIVTLLTALKSGTIKIDFFSLSATFTVICCKLTY